MKPRNKQIIILIRYCFIIMFNFREGDTLCLYLILNLNATYTFQPNAIRICFQYVTNLKPMGTCVPQQNTVLVSIYV